MNELLLQYIWQHQLFNRQSLTTVAGHALEIVDRGIFNTNQGPDFLNGKIRWLETTWAGHIELHVKGSDWKKHAHSTDRNYDNVILHVVWENDELLPRDIPTLLLEDRVSSIVLDRYRGMMRKNSFIPCENLLGQAEPLLLRKMQDLMLLRRLNRKADHVSELLHKNGRHWEEVQWWMLARSFGGNINGDAFESIARSIPFTTLARHRSQIHQLESILLGQGSLLDDSFTDPYAVMLQKEYRFLRQKYKLPGSPVSLLFLRMRPQNFPTIRLAQLAMLMHLNPYVFTRILEINDLKDVQLMFDVTANDYWHYHYRLEEASAFQPKTPGRAFIDSLILNAILPVVYCYGREQQDESLITKALRWINSMPSEKNAVVSGFQRCGVAAMNAGDSQSLLELRQHFCLEKLCLQCVIGKKLLLFN